MTEYLLKEREKAILRFIIHQFILTANPVGSRNISKKYDIGLSPASIRNIMADLEELGYLDHPHTSAGRVPTDRGYRFYVDSLMDPPNLGNEFKSMVNVNLSQTPSETEDLLKITSTMLSNLTNQLALVSYPKFEQAVLERIQIVRLSSVRILVVVTVQSGLIRTITLEIDAEVNENNISTVQLFLNERLSGLKFSDIRSTLSERMKDFNSDLLRPIIRVFIDSVDKIFTDISSEKTIISGAKNILTQPEFENHEQFQSVIELIENKDVIIHILEKKISDDVDLNIIIGKENEDEKFSDYSVITKEYKVGDLKGTLGIMGPKRMDYSKIIAAVVYIAEQLTRELTKQR
ncbi:MAG: heat-inducible transcriptional repressor HrcA [Melioribacteraceae bacterium]|nr:heat-inducible transcriptional repressor HrcA [Melioribacteraceae bacterium]